MSRSLNKQFSLPASARNASRFGARGHRHTSLRHDPAPGRFLDMPHHHRRASARERSSSFRYHSEMHSPQSSSGHQSLSPRV